MINIGLQGGSSGGGSLIKTVHIAPIVKLGDNLAVGMSQDGSGNNAQGTLYPSNLNTALTSQTQITSLFLTEAQQYYTLDDQQYDVNEVKTKIGEAFFSKYKKLAALLYSSYTALPRTLPNATVYINETFKIEWLDATRFLMLYADNSSGYVLKVVVGQVGSDGMVTWGTPAVIKTFTDATHYGYGAIGMAITDTDKALVTYTNKVSTSYLLKARVVTISGLVATPQSEGADNTNFGTSAAFKIPMVKIRGASGAGAVAAIVPAAAGGSSLTKIQAISHDNVNAVSYGAATTAGPASDMDGQLSFFSYATDRLIVATKRASVTTHIYAQTYTISGTTVTAVGSAYQITQSTSSTHYLPQVGHLGWINFGSNNLGMLASFSNSSSWRVILINVASDVLTVVDNADGSVSQLNNQTGTDVRAITLGDSTGLIYGTISGGGNPLGTWAVSYGSARANVSGSGITMNHDLGTNNNYIWPSQAKAIMFDGNSNNGASPLKYQIATGDTAFQVLDEANTVLATVTETNDGGGEVKLKNVQLPWAATRMIFKIKNTSAQARVIKLSAVYVEAE